MNPTFFKSFWRLVFSQVQSFTTGDDSEKAKKMVKDLFSTTFGKAVEYAQDDEKKSLSLLIQDKATLLATTSTEDDEDQKKISEKCLQILALWLSSSPDLDSMCSSLTSEILDHHTPATVPLLVASPIVNRVLSGFFPCVDDFVSRLDSILPAIEDVHAKTLLVSSCQVLAKDIESIMQRTITDISEWCHSINRKISDLELTLFALTSSQRITLFRSLVGAHATEFKEKFLVALAVAIRLGASEEPESATIEAVQKIFFFIPSAGIVMDRWLDKEVKKYNDDVLSRIRRGTVNQFNLEQFRGVIRGCFDPPAITILELPFGGHLDSIIADFIAYRINEDGKFKSLPCLMTIETIRTVLGNFTAFFQINDDYRLSLTPVGTRITPLYVQSLPDLPGPVSLGSGSGMVATDPPSHQFPAQTDDLVDVLLREILQRLPQHAFMHRSYPVKVQPGVYRFGTREVTFHTKGGALFVYRVGDYVSESEAIEFVAREYGVGVDKLKSQQSGSSTAPPPPSLNRPVQSSDFEGPQSQYIPEERKTFVAGMRRPMEWENDELMFRIVRRGMKAGDRVWRETWQTFCRTEGIPDSQNDPKNQSKNILAKFLESNMAHAARQEWAKNLLYYTIDDYASLPPLSDAEDEGFRARHAQQQQPAAAAVHMARPVPTGPNPADHPSYKTRLCMMFQQGRCTRGDTCGFAHGESDLRGSGTGGGANVATGNQFFKTRMCNLFLEGRCSRGNACSYAHSESERVAFASGVPRRDMKVTEDLRLAEKRKAMMSSSTSRRSPSPPSKRRNDGYQASKPLPYIPPSSSGVRRRADGSRIDETEL